MSNHHPWIEHIPSRAKRLREFFNAIFAKLEFEGFTLQNPDAIDGGYRLEFRKGDKHVVADRYCSFPVMGETPGIALHDDAEDWDCTFSAIAPLSMVLKSLEYLAEDENE